MTTNITVPRHIKTPTSPTKPITPGGWVRLGLYAVAVLAGLASVLAEPLGFGGLTDVLASISGLLLVATGGTAALNLGKADDQQVKLRELGPALIDVLDEVRVLRENAATADEVADAIEARQPKPEPEPVAPTTPVNPTLEQLRELVAENTGRG